MLIKNNSLKRQILSFLWVGILNTAVGYSLYAFFIFINIRYFLALFFTTCLGIGFNFMTTGKIVFKEKTYKGLLKFTVLYIILYFLGLVSMNFLKIFNINLYLSGFIIIILLSTISFVGNKFLVFREKNIKKYNSKEISCKIQ